MNIKNGCITSCIFYGFSKVHFQLILAFHCVFLSLDWPAGFTVPSLLKMTHLVSIHHYYTCSLQFLSFSLLFSPKKSQKLPICSVIELFQAQQCPILAVLVLIRHMEDINYVFNGEIRGNFNSYILIYDNFFLLKAICLGCALRSS